MTHLVILTTSQVGKAYISIDITAVANLSQLACYVSETLIGACNLGDIKS